MNELTPGAMLMTSALVEERIVTFKKWAKEGKSQADVIKLTGLSSGTVSQFSANHGIKFKRKSPRADVYKECAKKGMTRAQTAAHLGVTIGAVNNISLYQGISFESVIKRPYRNKSAGSVQPVKLSMRFGFSPEAVARYKGGE